MVTKKALLSRIGALESRIGAQEREILSLKEGIGSLNEAILKEKEKESKAAEMKGGDQRKGWPRGFGDFRASHPFRPDQGRKEE